MNLYLLIFDRTKGSVEIREFSDPEEAVVNLLEAERRRAYAPELEVVLLNAVDEDDLRRTHSRYFESIEELLEPA
jgi:hypothetical protein